MTDKKTRSEKIVNNPSKYPPPVVAGARNYLARAKAKKRTARATRVSSNIMPSARSNREAMLAQAFTPNLSQ